MEGNLLRARLLVISLTASWVAVVIGCGDDGPQRYQVKGSVTFAGKPVPFGQIVFEPDSGQGNSGPQDFAKISDGQYDTTTEMGVVGGPHLVRVTGASVAREDENNPSPPLFPHYQTKLDLPKEDSTQDIAVPGK